MFVVILMKLKFFVYSWNSNNKIFLIKIFFSKQRAVKWQNAEQYGFITFLEYNLFT